MNEDVGQAHSNIDEADTTASLGLRYELCEADHTIYQTNDRTLIHHLKHVCLGGLKYCLEVQHVA